MDRNDPFEGGGLTFWDGYDDPMTRKYPSVTHYDTRAGDVAFIDRYVVTFEQEIFEHKICHSQEW
jgi:hypothetical protein